MQPRKPVLGTVKIVPKIFAVVRMEFEKVINRENKSRKGENKSRKEENKSRKGGE